MCIRYYRTKFFSFSDTDYSRFGFQQLWETIIEKENITVKINADVIKLKPLTEKGTKEDITLN